MHVRHASGDVQQAVGCRSLVLGRERVQTCVWEQPAYRRYSEPGDGQTHPGSQEVEERPPGSLAALASRGQKYK